MPDAVLLRYRGGLWEPFASLGRARGVTQLVGDRGGVLFGGPTGWGYFSRDLGTCQFSEAVRRIVALENGTVFVLAEDPASHFWLFPRP